MQCGATKLGLASVAGSRLANLAIHMDEERYERENEEQMNENACDVVDDVTSDPCDEQQKRQYEPNEVAHSGIPTTILKLQGIRQSGGFSVG